MLLMNVFRLYTHWLPILFFVLLLALGLWFFRGRLVPSISPSYLSLREQAMLAILALAVGVLFASMRVPYLLEGHLHHLVGPVVYDDTWHFQEINSLVNSVRYPAQCSLIPAHYFSFYYAPWMMIAALYLALPIDGFTIKAAFAVGCAVYQILICLSLLHIATARARDRRHLYWAIYLVGFWAGLESLFSLAYYLSRDPGWMMLPATPIHLPMFEVGAIWAIHHVSAAVALMLCWYAWEASEGAGWQTVVCCSLLIGYAFYSSVFVFLGALPFGLFVVFLERKTKWKPILATVCLSGAAIWPLLWLYLGKTKDVRFLFPFMTGIRSLFPSAAGPGNGIANWPGILDGLWPGFLVFVLFLILNFLPHSLALSFYGRKLVWSDRIFAALAIVFLVSTYFIGFQEGDNYASRGYLIPILVLGWICAALLPRIRISAWVAIGLCLGAFGFVHEDIQTYKRVLYICHVSEAGPFSKEILAINRDRQIRKTPVENWDAHPALIYDIEKFVAGGKPEPVTADRQLECLGPRGPWRWQQVPEVPRN